jgi:hypothetical protein
MEPTDVMIATDAIGMGLNLRIGRIIFARLDKFDGTTRRPLSVSEMKQIGGRAGRFGSAFPVGVVTALQRSHLPQLSTALAAASPRLRSAGVLPQLAQLEEFAAALLQFSDDVARESESEQDTVRSSHRGVVPPPGSAQRADRRSDLLAVRETHSHLPGALDTPAGWAGLFDARGNFVELRLGRGALELPAGGSPSPDDDMEALRTAVSGLAAHGGSVAPSNRGSGSDAGGEAREEGRRVSSSSSSSDERDDAADCDDVDTSGDDDDDDDSDDDDSDSDDGELDAVLAGGRLRLRAARGTRRRRADAVLAAGVPFTQVLEGFLAYARVNTGLYHLCDCTDLLAISRKLDAVPGLPFRVRHAWCMAPADVDDPLLAAALKRYARKFAETGRVRVGLRVPELAPRTPAELAELESAHSVFDLYLWLGRRHPAEFVQLPQAVEAAAATQALIAQGLQAMGDEALAARAARRRRGGPATAVASPARDERHDDDDDDDNDPAAAGSEYLRSMIVADDAEGEEEQRGHKQRRRAERPPAQRLAAEEHKAAKKEARRAGRRAMSLLEHAFDAGGLAGVRRLQRGPAWRDALVESLLGCRDRVGGGGGGGGGSGGGKRERRGERPAAAWGTLRGGNEALLDGLVALRPRRPRAPGAAA